MQRPGDIPLRGIHINISSDPFQHRIPPYLQRAWQESRLSQLQARLLKRYKRATPIELFALSVTIFLGGMYLLVHVGFFSGRKFQDWRYDHTSGSLGGPWQQDVQLLDRLYPDDGLGLTTAVLLFEPKDEWSVTEDAEKQLAPLLEDLCDQPIMHRILIWNNNPIVNLTHAQLPSCNKVDIHNSYSNMHQAARYLGCSIVTTPYCYFQDHPGSRHLRSLYANFLRHPHLIHSESRDVDAHAQARWRWCFFNDDVHMHTCHQHQGYGTFVSRDNVLRFIELMELDPIDIMQSDMYFTTFMNQVPYQLEGTAAVFPAYIDEEDREGRLIENKNNPNLTAAGRSHVHNSIVMLYKHLSRRTNVFATEQVYPGLNEQDARTPCRNDRCLFLTNIPAFPDPRLFKYNPNINLSQWEDMHESYYNSRGHYAHFPYGNAVDYDDTSAWKAQKNISAGDYIGLDLLMPMRIPLKFRFLARHPLSYRDTLNIQISFDGQHWMKVPMGSEIDCDTFADDTMMECRFTISETGYRFVRLQSTTDQDYAYEIHDFSFTVRARQDIDGQLLLENDWLVG